MKGKTILVIDDEMDIGIATAECLQSELGSQGVRVLCAIGMDEALKAINENKIDSVICDYFMPDGNWRDIKAELEKTGQPDTFFMIYSAQIFEKDLLGNMVNSGVHAVATKPANFSVLAHIVREAVEGMSSAAA